MSEARLIVSTCACGTSAAHVAGQTPRCLACLRADHDLIETPADRFRRTPRAERQARYALTRLGGQGVASPIDAAARRTWSMSRDGEGLASHPPPEVPARPATGAEVPTGARELAVLAAGRGWQGAVTYARGYGIHSAHGAVLGLRHSVAVRLWHPDGRRAVAVWVNSGAAGGWVMVPGDMPRKVGVAGVKKWVASDGG